MSPSNWASVSSQRIDRPRTSRGLLVGNKFFSDKCSANGRGFSAHRPHHIGVIAGAFSDSYSLVSRRAEICRSSADVDQHVDQGHAGRSFVSHRQIQLSRRSFMVFGLVVSISVSRSCRGGLPRWQVFFIGLLPLSICSLLLLIVVTGR